MTNNTKPITRNTRLVERMTADRFGIDDVALIKLKITCASNGKRWLAVQFLAFVFRLAKKFLAPKSLESFVFRKINFFFSFRLVFQLVFSSFIFRLAENLWCERAFLGNFFGKSGECDKDSKEHSCGDYAT